MSTRSYPTHDVPVEGAVERGRVAARALAESSALRMYGSPRSHGTSE